MIDRGACNRSDELSENISHSNLKALVLNKVIVGEGCKVTQDNTTLKTPPKGYDSVRTFDEWLK